MSRGKSRKRVAILAALLCAAASVKVVANPSVQRPVATFIYFYQQGEDLGPFARVLYSVVMTTAPSS